MGQPVEILINLKKTGQGGKEAEDELSGVQKAAKLAGAALGAMASVQTAKAAYEFAKLGAQSVRTRNAFYAISGGADEASERLAAMQRATRGAISEQAAMESANRLMQMGLANNAQELEKVTTMAVRLGTAMGRDANASIEEFALLLANQSIPRLDTFGISAGKTRERINELRAANEGMTRETAFMTAVMEQGEESLQRLGPAMEDDMLAAEQLEAAWADLKTMVAEQVAPAMATLVGGMADGMRAVNEQTATMRQYNEVLGQQATTSAYVAAHYQGQAGALQDLQAQYEETKSKSADLQNAEREAGEAFSFYTGEAERAREISLAAAEAQTELSTSAGKVAKSFGDIEFDDETMWKMALASGANLDQLAELAGHLGIATDAEIEHTIEAYKMVEAFGAGTLGASELSQGFWELQTAEQDADTAGQDFTTMSGEATDKQGLLADATRITTDEMNSMALKADEVTTALSRIPTKIEVEVKINTSGDTSHLPPFQHGTPFAAGGLAMLGEGGPELAFLPRGTAVMPAWETRSVTRSMTDNRSWSRGGDTIIVQDRLAAAMVLEERRRGVDRRLARGF